MKKSVLLIIAVLALFISGCSQKTPEIDSGPVLDSGYSEQQKPVLSSDDKINQIDSFDQSEKYVSEDDLITSIETEVNTLYFATDSYQLSDSEMIKLTQNSNIFNGELSSDLSIKIEGNCDEWGTDEYNYALGLKRAKSVKNSLNQMGVSEDRMSLISYGESKPICSEHNAGCWQQNRRVDFKLFP